MLNHWFCSLNWTLWKFHSTVNAINDIKYLFKTSDCQGVKEIVNTKKEKTMILQKKSRQIKRDATKKGSNLTDSVTKCRHRKHPEVKVKYQKTLYYENITFVQYTIKVCNNALSDRMFKDQKHILTAK